MKPEDDELDAGLKRALSRDPGDRYFDTFASRVAERIAAESQAEARRKAEANAPWWRGLFASPRALATAGGVAALVLVAAASLMLTRDQQSGPQSMLAERQLGASAPAPAAAPSAETERKESDATAGPADLQPGSAGMTSSEPAGGAAATGSAPAARTLAVQPQRMQEMRTTESGDQVPVPTAWQKRVAEREAAAAPETSGPKSITQLKREANGPLAGAVGKTAAPAPPAVPVDAARRVGAGSTTTSKSLADAAEAPSTPAPVVEARAKQRSETPPTSANVVPPRGGAQRAPIEETAPAPAQAESAVGDDRTNALAPPVPSPGWGGAVQSFRGDAEVSKRAYSPPGVPVSPFAGELPAMQARIDDANQKLAAARRAKTGASWDVAAQTWHSLAGALSTPEARVEASWRAADALQRAWRAEPTPAREAAAADAARAFAALAPRDSRVRSLMSPSLPWGKERAGDR